MGALPHHQVRKVQSGYELKSLVLLSLANLRVHFMFLTLSELSNYTFEYSVKLIIMKLAL